jgi:hypothetical protein
VKRKIVIEPYEEYPTVNYYVIRFKDEEESEFDKFLDKFDGDEYFEDSFNIIIEYLDRIGNEGALDVHLRREGGSLKAMPIGSSKLRLYCFRVGENIVVLGNGGHKPKEIRAYQQSPELSKYVSDLREAGRKLLNRTNHTTNASIHNGKLYGNLEFEIETTDLNDNNEKK